MSYYPPSMLGGVTWTTLSGKPSVFPPDTHNHDASYSLTSHNHDGTYATAGHNHAGVYEPVISAGTAAQYWRGDKTWQTLPGGMTWIKLASDGSSTTSNSVYTASALTFTATANTTYIIELNGSFQTAATTTGISVVLDIPSGVVMGNFMHHAAAAQTLTGIEQVADNASPQTGTSGVRAANVQTSMLGRWIIEIGASGGAVTLMYRSEVSGSAVILKKPTALGYQAI